VILAQAAGTDPLVNLLSTGGAVTILALAVVAFLRGWIRRGADYDQILAENRRLQQVFEERVLPALMRSNELLSRAADKAGGG
jgi:hypothetical protein